MTPDRHNRRKFLAAAGAAGVGMTGIATADHGSNAGCGGCNETEQTDSCGKTKQTDGGWDPAAGGRTCSLKCGQAPPDFHPGPSSEAWYESSITFHNCSDCPRHIEAGVSGEISQSKETPHEMTNHTHQSYHLNAGERKTFWFTGSIVDLHLNPCDINVAISQRSGHRSKHDECK